MAIETALRCPQCGEIDAVRKVSAIYNGGFSTIPNDSPLVPYGVVDRTITTITPLAQKLAPPIRPNIQRPIEYKPTAGRWFIFIVGKIFMILMTAGMAISGIGGIWVMWTVGGISLEMIFMAGIGVFGIVGVIAISVNFFSKIRDYLSGKTKQEINAVVEKYTEKYDDIMSEYELARFWWDSAYYCGRCDGVFTLGKNEFTPINQFQRFIHK
jgi:uncharacterized C2H2 Zn-finger protein